MKQLIRMLLCCFAVTAAGADLSLEPAGRTAFQRNEAKAVFRVTIRNHTGQDFSDVVLSGVLNGIPTTSVKTAVLKGNDETVLNLPMETRLKPGTYPCKLTLRAHQGGKPVTAEKELSLRIGPAAQDKMPVVIWGYNNDYKTFQKLGFTHGQESASVIYTRDWDKQERVRDRIRRYDDMLADGFQIVDYFFVPHIKKYQEEFPRYGRDGKPRGGRRNLEASNPGARELCRGIAEKTALAFQDHPTFDGLLINSEIRDDSNPSFGKTEPEAFRKHAGFDIPQEVEDKQPQHYSRIKDFPFSRVIPENHPLFVYYRWFWKDGDGWNPLHTLIHESYKKQIKRPFWTFFDPAVRVPPVWGSGGKVDYLSHWTYAYPDPINIGANTSELQAMAKGQRGQGVMNMTQIICYRSATAPVGQKVDHVPAWGKEHPKASYITLAPDLMREAVWTQLSRHVSGIMFHGYNSLIPDPKNSGYTCTNQETAKVLSGLLNDVVKPLGPVLKRIPERSPEVAVLESFASSVFAGRGTWGWTGWAFDVNLMLMWANLAPAVVYEETLLRDGFGNLKVLVLPHCDVLTEPVFKAVQEFQRKGGILVADETVVPGITPDIPIKTFARTRNPQTDKAELQKIGTNLRKQLAPYYTPYAGSSNPDLLTWVRSDRNADYLFVINDRRTFGDYYGQYGLVMEKGMPNSGTVTLNRRTGAVYDLTRQKAVPFQDNGRSTAIPVAFDNAGGNLFLVLPEAIVEVTLKIPETAERGKGFPLEAAVTGRGGNVIPAWIPIRITVTDPDGKQTDNTRYAAVENGIFQTNLIPALNEKTGIWNITVRELAGGTAVKKSIAVR